ncbi:MAG: autotransporter outer membrane beta-barrel domain-containing protein [Haemophilus parainfluenzae]|nr:pertactin family autotransporter [Haemophilus parainfluenzae]MDU4783575.1 autotransporter outer membrane beta-barrel domain-containing protein [Haemophilus parainfluenzae]MDU7655767.1 autotransporter outer membrane beta-barrel domain-containing protein [Haemophilus parainfluenzae]
MKNNKILNRTFKVSLVAMALGLVNSAWAIDYKLYEGTVYKNPERTDSEVKNMNFYSDYGYDLTNKNNLAHVSFRIKNSSNKDYPTESLIFLDPQFSNGPSSLEIKPNSTFTLSKAFPESSVFELRDANLKFHFGNINLFEGLSTVDADGEPVLGNSAFELQSNSTIDIDSVSIVSAAKESIGYQLFDKSTANIINSSIFLGGDNSTAVDAENSTLHIKNLNIALQPAGTDKSATIAYASENSTLNIEDSLLTIETKGQSKGLGFVLDGGVTNITNSNIENNAGDVVIFTNKQDSRDETNNYNSTTVNLKNTKIPDAKVLVGLNMPDLADTDLSEGEKTSSPRFVLNADNSQLNGAVKQYDGTNKTPVTLNLTNNTTWDLVDNSEVTDLHLNNSAVSLTNTNAPYATLTITGNLTGSGTFNLNTNIAENKSDKIVVQGTAEGNHKIGVTNQGANVANGKVTLVETNGGNAAFSLTNPNNRVDLGAYQYFLTKEGNNWVLANSKNAVTPTSPAAPVTPVTPNKPVVTPNKPVATPTTPVLPSTPLLSDLANAQVSLRQAQLLLVEDDLSGIHQRLGEVKNGEKGNVWVRNVNSRQKLAALSTGKSETFGFKQNVHSVQVGADAAVTDNIRVGGFVGRSQANVDFNGHYGDGKVRSNSMGLYAAYLADNSIYVDNIVKYSRLHANSDLAEKRHYNAYTISSELGKRFSLANDWIITPQAQLAWTHISSQENEDSLSSVYSRIGLRVAKGFALSNGWNLQPYAEVNAITSKNRSSKIHYTNSALDVASSRGRFESAVGLNAGFANHRFGLEVSRADGKNFDKPYAIQAVYRYQW